MLRFANLIALLALLLLAACRQPTVTPPTPTAAETGTAAPAGDSGQQGPYTWPRTMAQLAADKEALPASGCDAPLFPFGYWLTTAGDGHVELLSCP